jgi:crossover junction endodeoxyribonuclease RuvC
MIIIGIDPGTIITGIGIVETSGKTITPVYYDVVKLDKYAYYPTRLKKIYDALLVCFDEYHPDEFAIETAFFGKNVQSALKIGQARGVSILAAMNREIPITEYSPKEIKKSVTGNGSASKEQVAFMVKSILNLRKSPKHLDTSDALAIALCHCNRITTPRSKFTNWKSFIETHPERVIKN